MSAASGFFEGYIADYIIANGIKVSLHTGDPSGGNEVVGGAYARADVTFEKSGSEPTILTNTAIVEFPVATANWGTITHAAIQSAAIGGNMIAKFAVSAPKAIASGDVARFLTGEIDVVVD